MRDSNTVNMHQQEPSMVSDEALVRQYANGDALAFEKLYTRHKSGLFSFIRRQCNDVGVAEELAHDSWLAVIKQANDFQSNALFKTWIYRIAHNRLVDYWRKYGRSNHALLNELNECDTALDRSSEFIELTQLFAQLDALSDEQTTTLLLKIEGFSYAEIASITNSKQETVKSRLRYATQRLRVAMELS